MTRILSNLPPIHKQLIGHRGAAGLAPENTLSSFIQASILGLNWVEFDIQMCASGEWVVIHDEAFDRTTNGTGLVTDTPYELIKTFKAGEWFSPAFKNEHVPLLGETLSCLVDLNIHPNIEIKPIKYKKSSDYYQNNNDQHGKNNKIIKMQNFLAQLQVAWPSSLAPPLVSSFDWELLLILRALSTTLPLGYIVEEIQGCTIDMVLKHGINTLHCDHQKLFPENIQKAQANNLPLLVYTINEANQIKKMLQIGISAVFSDLTGCSRTEYF